MRFGPRSAMAVVVATAGVGIVVAWLVLASNVGILTTNEAILTCMRVNWLEHTSTVGANNSATRRNSTTSSIGRHGYDPELKDSYPMSVPSRTHMTNSNHKEERGRSRTAFISYHLDQQVFVKIFSGCIIDPHCSIQYLHRAKTGGTFLEGVISQIVDRRRRTSCCKKNNTMMARFIGNIGSYCNASFSSYQVDENDFLQILKTCQRYYQERNEIMERIIAITTYREPIARAVSSIHQLCNKKPEKRAKKVLEICERCKYENDTDYYNSFSGRLQRFYERMLTNRTFWYFSNNVEFLVLDNMDIDSLLDDLKDSLPVKYKERFFDTSNIYANEEKKRVCNFHVPSAMIKVFRLDQIVYRNISLGWLK